MQGRGIFLDRDGVINRDDGYVVHKERFIFNEEIFPFLRWAENLGFRLIIVTNQSAIARSYASCEEYEELTAYMLGKLRAEDIIIDRVRACFYHKDGKDPAFTRESFWRKPNPGMILEALQELNLSAARSAIIGDQVTDMLAGKRAGITHRFGLGLSEEPDGLYHAVKDFKEIQEMLASHEREPSAR